MTINAPAPVLVAMYHVACELQGRDGSQIRGTAQNDVLKEYVSRGTYIYPPAPSLRLAADLIAWCATDAPRFNAISLSGYHMREAGCTAAQEMGFAVANAIAYVAGGGRPRSRRRRLRAAAVVDLQHPHELLRGDREVPGAAAGVGARDARPFRRAPTRARWQLRTHTQTAGSTLTLQQPENNIVRAAVQALAAALGGVQSMALSCFDEAIAIPTQHAQTLAVRTQQMLQHEFGITEVADPLGGSWFVEQLTDRLERRGARLIDADRRDGRRGGGVENGFYQQMIADEAYAARAPDRLGRGRRGGRERVHRGRARAQPEHFDVPRSSPAISAARLEALRAERDGGAVTAALEALASRRPPTANLMPRDRRRRPAEATLGRDLQRAADGVRRLPARPRRPRSERRRRGVRGLSSCRR